MEFWLYRVLEFWLHRVINVPVYLQIQSPRLLRLWFRRWRRLTRFRWCVRQPFLSDAVTRRPRVGNAHRLVRTSVIALKDRIRVGSVRQTRRTGVRFNADGFVVVGQDRGPVVHHVVRHGEDVRAEKSEERRTNENRRTSCRGEGVPFWVRSQQKCITNNVRRTLSSKIHSSCFFHRLTESE